jgi:hypothetical protein
LAGVDLFTRLGAADLVVLPADLVDLPRFAGLLAGLFLDAFTFPLVAFVFAFDCPALPLADDFAFDAGLFLDGVFLPLLTALEPVFPLGATFPFVVFGFDAVFPLVMPLFLGALLPLAVVLPLVETLPFDETFPFAETLLFAAVLPFAAVVFLDAFLPLATALFFEPVLPFTVVFGLEAFLPLDLDAVLFFETPLLLVAVLFLDLLFPLGDTLFFDAALVFAALDFDTALPLVVLP